MEFLRGRIVQKDVAQEAISPKNTQSNLISILLATMRMDLLKMHLVNGKNALIHMHCI